MAIKTLVKHKADKYADFTTQYGIDKIGFNLKLLEFVAKGYTDGSFTTSTEVEPEIGEVIVNTRIWTNQDAANAWVEMTLATKPSTCHAEVIIE